MIYVKKFYLIKLIKKNLYKNFKKKKLEKKKKKQYKNLFLYYYATI